MVLAGLAGAGAEGLCTVGVCTVGVGTAGVSVGEVKPGFGWPPRVGDVGAAPAGAPVPCTKTESAAANARP